MSKIYQKTKDVYIQRRNANNNGFDEYPLIVQPSSVVVTDEANNLVIMPLGEVQFVSASYAYHSGKAYNADTASYLLGTIQSASYIATASNAVSTSYAAYAANAGSASSALNSISSSYVKAINVDGTVASATNAINANTSYVTTDNSSHENPLIFASIGGTVPGYNVFYEGGVATYNPSSSVLTATLKGTSSWANSASWSPPQSFIQTPTTQSIYATESVQASLATQSLFATQSIFATSSLSASWASSSLSSSRAITASYALSSSIALTASYISTNGSVIISNYEMIAKALTDGMTGSISTLPYTKSLGTIPSNGLYRLSVDITILTSDDNELATNNLHWYFMHTDNLGTYYIPGSFQGGMGDDDSGHLFTFNVSVGTTDFGIPHLPPPGFVCYDLFSREYVFKATAGSTLEYYYDSGGLPLGQFGALGTASFSSSVVVEQLATW
jgi:hypothetical protein